MTRSLRLATAGLIAATLLIGCTSTRFVSTWKAPDAKPFEVRGTKVAAVVMMRDESVRREAEDLLAKEITTRGAVGVPMYTIYPGSSTVEEPAARTALENAGIVGAVVMRPAGVETQIVSTPVVSTPLYGGFWGGYYSAGWAQPWDLALVTPDIRTKRVVSVETLVYSLRQNKLLWAGKSKLTDPESVEREVKVVAAAVAAELTREGLLKQE